MSRSVKLLWVNKDASSESLSHSDHVERIKLLSHAQRISRPGKRNQPRGRPSPKKDKLPIRRPNSIYDGPVSGFPSPAIRTPPPLDPTWSEDEKRSFTFFHQVTITKIVTLERDFAFWTEKIPSLAFRYAPFRHLVVAIASTHELLFRTDSARLDVFALTQCNKATELLRTACYMQPACLVVSCILMAAYSLLRCEYTYADMGVESGLKIPLCPETNDDTTCTAKEVAGAKYKHILTRLGKSHGFKLWAPDISHQFEKSKASPSCLTIETDHIKGPFTDVPQVVKAFRDFMLELVTKIMRNLARGYYIDPQSPLAQDIIRQLNKFSYFWDKLYNQHDMKMEEQRFELKQLRVGINQAYLAVFTKMLSREEKTFDAYPNIVDSSLDLGEEIFTAFKEGRTVVYMDRVVNSGLFSMGTSTRDPTHRRRVKTILRGQTQSPDGLDHWLRATIIDLLEETENREWGRERDPEGIVPRDRIIFSDMTCHGNTARLDYLVVGPHGERSSFVESVIDWEEAFGADVTSKMVNDSLQGIMAAYRTYGKPRPSEAPLGYVREMRYRGRPVQVCKDPSWRLPGES